MMMWINHLPPAFILILGAFLVPFLHGRIRNIYVVALPILAFLHIYQLDTHASLVMPFLGFDVGFLRADTWAKAFGYVFTLSAFVTFIYGFYQKKNTEYFSALLYIGSALGVVFSRDIIALYVFWEIMAITSVMLILARNTKKARAAAIRYVIVHVFGGLVLLAGVLLHIHHTGSILFETFTQVTPATILILAGFLVNAAAYPISSWLPDSYPEASEMGGVILSAYTSKTAVYTLIRGFPGWDILIFIGCFMAIYGIIYALLENDMRRILAYSIINQVGFMVAACGIGTPLALAGAVAHAFCHIIYKALLWMSAGAVIYRTGKSKCTELGGLYQTMPWTFVFGTIGALAISSLPLTSGFTSKTIILAAAEAQHLFWPWLILEIASAGVFLHAGIKFPYFVFFAKDSGLRPKEAPKSMLFAMGILSFLCIYLGCFPKVLYNILPNAEIVTATMPFTFSDIYIHHFPKVITQMQLLLFSGVIFFLFLPLLKRTDTISLDIDWVYRKGSKGLNWCLDRLLNGLNQWADHWITRGIITNKIVVIGQRLPLAISAILMGPVYELTGLSKEKQQKRQALLEKSIQKTLFPIGLVGFSILTVLGFLIVILF